MATRKKYTKEFKLDAAGLVLDQGYTRIEAARMMWILRTGAQWSEMPNRYPPYQAYHRRFQQRRESGIMDQLLVVLARI